jgi:sterol desaturase/sphingolipid hydroxylase (fatty acid hydroxylase superfamily)
MAARPLRIGYAAYKGQQFHWLHHHYFECNYGSVRPRCDAFGVFGATLPEKIGVPQN